MGYVAAIKSENKSFEIEAASWFINCPKETLVTNHVSGNTLDKMANCVVDHTIGRFISNNQRLTEFCITTGFIRKVKVRIKINPVTILYNKELYNGAIYYIIFMIAYGCNKNLELTEEELSKWQLVQKQIANGALLIYY